MPTRAKCRTNISAVLLWHGDNYGKSASCDAIVLWRRTKSRNEWPDRRREVCVRAGTMPEHDRCGPRGPVENRSGFRYVREVKDSDKKTRLIPFVYSDTQTMIIEMGEGYFRFHTQGQTILDESDDPYEIENNYDEDDLFDIHYVQSADVMTLVHRNYPPMELRRYGATDWRFAAVAFTPTVSPPEGIFVEPFFPGVCKLTIQPRRHKNRFVLRRERYWYRWNGICPERRGFGA